MKDDFDSRLDTARTLPDIFEIVKEAVRKSRGRGRAGLMLGLADLGNLPNGFFGAFYPVGSNIIVVNYHPMNWVA